MESVSLGPSRVIGSHKDRSKKIRVFTPESALALALSRRIVDFQRWEGEWTMIANCEEAQVALGAAGMVVEGPTQRIIDIADANGTAPQAVEEIIPSVARPATPEEIAASPGPEAPAGRFAHPPSGLGIDLSGIIDALNSGG